MNAAAIVVAAGSGRRMGGDLSKTYLPIAGRPMILRTLDRLCAARTVREMIIVVSGDAIDHCRALFAGDPVLKQHQFILQPGGVTRQESVRCGLQRVGSQIEVVVIHDGARPFVTPSLIDRCVAVAAEKGAAAVGLPVRDTIKLVGGDGLILSTPERAGLWEVQTPQAFRREWIVEAHARAQAENFQATDDAMVVERLGKPVYVVEGERLNFKITLPEDVVLAEALISAGQIS